VIESVEWYYSRKLEKHGPTPAGVDWNGDRSQRVRFEQLLRILGDAETFSLNDYGCGYGALVDHLQGLGRDFRYTGYDIAPAMVAVAEQRFAGEPRARFTSDPSEVAVANFTVASGVFNVRLQTPLRDWSDYVFETLEEIARMSTTGFAFNALTSHTDPGRRRDDLFYADPSELLAHCLRRYSRDVALLHDYELYEFTVLVRLDARPPADREGEA
jgi:SAM-dependent methyltransferase